jgi:hypothetical protein
MIIFNGLLMKPQRYAKGHEEVLSNQKFLQGPGAVFSKRAPGRRRQKVNFIHHEM